MPLYDYRCVNCGDFREFRPMAESGAAHTCPVCGEPSGRVFTTPFLAARGASDSPSPQPYGRQAFGHVCGHGCSHSRGA